MIYEAYFDETGDDGAFPLFGFAGYGFRAENARELEKEWSVVLSEKELEYFHMVECAHGHGQYAEMDLQERIDLQTKLIYLIKKYADRGYVCMLPLDLHDALDIGAINHAGRLSVIMPQAHIEDCKLDVSGISIFYEAGRKHLKRVAQLVNFSPSDVASISAINKKDSGCVQAADILAWQYAKYIKNVVSGRNVRKDFLSLMELNTWLLVSYVDENGMHVIVQLDHNETRDILQIDFIMNVFGKHPDLAKILRNHPHKILPGD